MSTGLLIRYMINKYHYIHKIIGKYANEQVITYPHYERKKIEKRIIRQLRIKKFIIQRTWGGWRLIKETT